MITIHKMYEHLTWSNHRILQALQQESQLNLEVLRLFSHILQAEQVWIARIKGKDSSRLPIWSDSNLAHCEQLIEQNQKDLQNILAGITEVSLARLIPYKNSKGSEFSTSLEDILVHVALHGQYHRGQINSKLRLAGLEPVNTDYITFVR
ncbi:DinB family protein [Ammoniphilus sp. YIM 78166]|uniref:DinB family protein n=1 Tax=Ammoniphilus sp. YIM 78166 TaxID=1644106 RepID=UPI00106F5EC3|nr:DinB family protein [Ammoniphilus sp. YIM 78166]